MATEQASPRSGATVKAWRPGSSRCRPRPCALPGPCTAGLHSSRCCPRCRRHLHAMPVPGSLVPAAPPHRQPAAPARRPAPGPRGCRWPGLRRSFLLSSWDVLLGGGWVCQPAWRSGPWARGVSSGCCCRAPCRGKSRGRARQCCVRAGTWCGAMGRAHKWNRFHRVALDQLRHTANKRRPRCFVSRRCDPCPFARRGNKVRSRLGVGLLLASATEGSSTSSQGVDGVMQARSWCRLSESSTRAECRT